ncbi:hypothetical protein Hanom_Chr12g01094941 [Helianthus anomalus]
MNLNDQNTTEDKDKTWGFKLRNLVKFKIWTRMTTKCKPQGPRCKKFEIWTKMTKVPKPQGPKWKFTLRFIYVVCTYSCEWSRLHVFYLSMFSFVLIN